MKSKKCTNPSPALDVLRLPLMWLQLAWIAICSLTAQAQTPSSLQQEMPAESSTNALFTPIPLPSPGPVRTAQGYPGPGYWQQKADYRIRVTLDPSSHRISGTVNISYTNNSPDPLNQLWIQLDQNAFSADSRSAYMQNDVNRKPDAFSDGGFVIYNVLLNRLGQNSTPRYTISDTRLRIPLDTPLPPNGSVIDISIDFSFVIPEQGADRMGRLDVQQGTVYQIAQWYPRMYVYDDVKGWNTLPYLGQGEFYLNYGSVYAEISVPPDFIVAGTGTLLNPEEVYTDTQLSRLEQARAGAGVIPIITATEVGTSQSRPYDADMTTWTFQADHVRDFAWAASQAFILDAASWEDVLVMSVYPRESLGTTVNPGWERSTEYMLHSLQYYSNMWSRYPYPVAINVAGRVTGMDYPMVLFSSMYARDEALFGITDHELSHTWFPLMVGSDERRYAWMDEGFSTFMNYYSALTFYGHQIDRLQRLTPQVIAGRMRDSNVDQSIMTYPDRIQSSEIGFLAYRKPAMGLQLLREYILGPDRFDPALKTYINRWSFKHPQPADFFRSIEQETGEDLTWFWNGWFYGTASFDQAVNLIDSDQNQPIVAVHHRTNLLLPVDLFIQYTDGTFKRVRIPVEAFFVEDHVAVDLVDNARIQRITVDPDERLPDMDRSNNVWNR